MLKLLLHSLCKLTLLIIPSALSTSVLFPYCKCVEESIPDFLLYETPYYPAVTESLPVVTAKPDPYNFFKYKISGKLRVRDRIVIMGTLRKPTITPPSQYVAINQTYVYRIPQKVHIGDNITVHGTLQENAKGLQFQLIHRELQKYYTVDYLNIAVKFSANISNVTDSFDISTISETTVTNAWNVKPVNKTFVDEKFKFFVGISPKSKSENDFLMDLYCNDKLIQTIPQHYLDRVGYLQISGHYSAVQSVQFRYA